MPVEGLCAVISTWSEQDAGAEPGHRQEHGRELGDAQHRPAQMLDRRRWEVHGTL